MKKTVLIMGLALASNGYCSGMINGAGSSFVYPAMSAWAQQYFQKTQQKINYQSIGSTGGVNQLKANTVDFAASDIPQSASTLAQQHWAQFPVVMGGIVPIVHLDGVKSNQLVVSGPVLAKIYLSKIQYWDNPEIKHLNPGLSLAHTRIITVHRADGSGTTFNFTHYLSQVSPDFKTSVGTSSLVSWPGVGLGGKGNAGVASQVQNIDNSIGYVEYAYAKESNLTTVAMINAAQKRVVASLKSFTSAAEQADWKAHPDYQLLLGNQPGANSWPIVASTFVLLPLKAKQVTKTLSFFNWVFDQGAASAIKLDYVPLPKTLVTRIRATLTQRVSS